MARCAGRESEGPVFSLAAVGMTILRVVDFLVPETGATDVSMLSAVDIITLSATVALALVGFIYSIRVYSGLIEVYGERKSWMWLWLLTDFIPALIWGLNSKYQPAWKVEDILQNKIAEASQVDAYANTNENILSYWLRLLLFVVAFAALSTITLEFIDKDKR